MAGNRVSFAPHWDGEIEGYAKRWVAQHHWRVRRLCAEREDSLAECMVVFAKVARVYAGKVDNPRWFMALFKKALANYWIQLARHDTRLAKGDAVACQLAEARPQTEVAVQPWAVLATELDRRVPRHLWPLTAPPPTTLPQCGRASQRALLRALWREAA